MKIIRTVLLTVAVVLSNALLQAQIAPFGIRNNDVGPVPAGSSDSDSIVQLTADAQGLPAVSPDQMPFSGTFWTITPGIGPALPFPCPPPGTLPTYALQDGSFLVDDTATSNSVNEADLIWQATEVTNLVGQAQAAMTWAQNQPMARAMDEGLPVPGDGGEGGEIITNTFYAPPDYGTNLWIAQTDIASGYLTGIGTNTLADVSYTILGLSDLTQTNWTPMGTIVGSETTNWTPLNPLSVNFQTNLFVKLRSEASSDGTGLPDWWELEYFGQDTNVNPNALDFAGDGWTIYQKFLLGVAPGSWYTPSAPQGLSVTCNITNSIATVTWLPSPGPVTSYTLIEQDNNTGQKTTNTLSAASTSFADNLSVEMANSGPQLVVDYTLYANYGVNGSSAPAMTSIDDYNDPSVPVAKLIAGPQGRIYYIFASLPSDLSAIRIYRANNSQKSTGIDDDYENNGANSYTTLADGYFEIPAASITNGVCPLSDAQAQPFFQYAFSVQTVRSNGVASGWALTAYYNSAPFADGRSQLKDNLRFVLREAAYFGPFAFADANTGVYEFPANYAFASCYSSGFYEDGPYVFFDALRPFYDNACYRNFVYNPTNLDTTGFLNTGCYYDGDPSAASGYFGYDYDSDLCLTNATTYFFDVADYLASTNPVAPSSQITSSEATWILPIQQTGNASVGDVNFLGLPYVSEEDTYVTNNEVESALLYPGDPTTFAGGDTEYVQVAQPVFEPDGYYFTQYQGYNGLMPEEGGFSLTNTTRTMITGLGVPLTIAGYAQFMVSNTPCYLGQYFDQAYEIDTNGNVTDNPTGILSPYGNFFPTQPGAAALVTMPDVDPPYGRGTCMVYTVSLQLDANHDGNMDLSYSGADGTSFNSPFVFWCNNNFDRWATTKSLYGVLFTDVEQDDQKIGTCPATPSKTTPDGNYKNAFGQRVIPCTRDLEDYARLWVCGVTTNLLGQLPYGSSVTLSWGDVGNPNTNNPTIDLFQAADTDGVLATRRMKPLLQYKQIQHFALM